MAATHPHAPSETTGRGRDATAPREIPRKGWVDVLKRTKDEAKADNVPLLAAGVAFYALLSLVPALAALVSTYGLVADPADIDRQVSDSLAAAPEEVRNLVSEQMTAVTQQSQGGLGITVVVSILIALWSASSGMKHLMTAVNVAYDEEETRGFVALRLRALLLTVGAIAFVIVAVGVITVVPALLDDTSLGGAAQLTISILRFPLLGLGLMAGLAVLYRYAPDRDEPRWTWTAPGTVVATVLWLVGSLLFSLYTSTMGSYAETYGALGAIVVLMLWLMISAAAVVIGAEINAESERQTVRDSTEGRSKPLGDRNAFAADTVGS
ncbi:YihY/virulence factor BrkB family protein [Iamia sp. SCSIO 61187]|uniref:YihY/virulence factor BrkB family protein n=1 Tax=Iamia sp. SCSIO 61187 TaxID=2722752 RepID=UPI001C626742|nr:YihY/virulence factor BrkB family protein [Iamia sp. SCSIO 61187]QYG92289.1 YihY/virulence factor BrkB family protein [Iamia sp. SCSIO 61187]